MGLGFRASMALLEDWNGMLLWALIRFKLTPSSPRVRACVRACVRGCVCVCVQPCDPRENFFPRFYVHMFTSRGQ